MKLLHSIAGVMIGFATLASIAPTEARADRVIELDPAVAAALRFGRYSGDVDQSVARFEEACADIRDGLASDLAGVTSHSARKQLVKQAKQALKAARDQARAEIAALAAEVSEVLGAHPAGARFLPTVQDVRSDAVGRVNDAFQAYSREIQSLPR